MTMATARPILNDLSAASTEYGKRLLLGIAFACNMGGMISPIASPQSIIAYSALRDQGIIDFVSFVALGTTVSFICFIFSFLIIASDQPIWDNSNTLTSRLLQEDSLPPVSKFKASSRSYKEYTVLAAIILSLFIWTCDLDFIIGDVGISSLIPIILLFTIPGILTKADLLSLPWDVCLLISGGSMLATAVTESGLLKQSGTSLEVAFSEMPAILSLGFTCFLITLISTFVSHTAAANVLMPFIVQLAKQEEEPRNLAMAACLCLSIGSALPISSFPNINASSVAWRDGSSWLHTSDFVKSGVIISVFATLTCVTLASI